LSSVAFWLYNIFPHYFINDTIIGKKVTEYKMYFVFLCTFFFFSKNFYSTYFIKIHTVEAVLFHAGGQADMMKLSHFSQFGECVKKTLGVSRVISQSHANCSG
jgi:hypothetical protein